MRHSEAMFSLGQASHTHSRGIENGQENASTKQGNNSPKGSYLLYNHSTKIQMSRYGKKKKK